MTTNRQAAGDCPRGGGEQREREAHKGGRSTGVGSQGGGGDSATGASRPAGRRVDDQGGGHIGRWDHRGGDGRTPRGHA
jgi:hypothetical protein